MSATPRAPRARKEKTPKPTAEPGTPDEPKAAAPARRARKQAKGEGDAPKAIEPEVVEAEPDVEAAEPTEADLAEVEVEAQPAAPSAKAARPLAPIRASSGRDSLQQYMNEVGRYALLTREQEHELAVRYRETGDLDAAYKLVASNLRLVVKIAFEYHRTAFNILDLVQEGNVGLMHAVKKYDPYKGVKLSSYAAWWIRAFILRYIMENWRSVKLGTTQAQRKLFFNLKKEKDRLQAQGFDATPKLLAERLDVTEQDVIDMDRRLSQDEFSLDAPVGDESRQSHADRLAQTDRPVDERLADTELADLFRRELVEFAKTITDEKERYIFEKRLTSEEPLKLQEIGDKFGVSRERARQIEAKLIARLKHHLQAKLPDFKELSFERED